MFSKFDWDAHALSLQGPIPLSSFPEPQGVTSAFAYITNEKLSAIAKGCMILFGHVALAGPAADGAWPKRGAVSTIVGTKTTVMPAVEPVAGAEGGALLRGDVLNAMLEMYSPRLQQGPGKTFAIKNMNIVDPLLPTNNLGRSVNKASKARIRKALAHGSHMLDSIFEKVCCTHSPVHLCPRLRCEATSTWHGCCWALVG